MMRGKIALAILCLMLVYTAKAQQQDTLYFTLDEALQYAMEHSFNSKNADIDLHTSQKKVWETIASGLPQVDASAGYTANLNLPVSLIPAEFVGGEPGTYIPVKFGQDYNSNFGFSVSQMIFDGSYLIGLKSAKIYVDLARNAKEKTNIAVREAVTSAYFTTLIAEEKMGIVKDNLLNSEQLLKEAKAYYENGFREEQDVEQLQLMKQQAENEVIKAEREIRVSKMVLKFAMGMSVDKDIQLKDSLQRFIQPIRTGAALTEKFDYTQHIDYRIQETQVAAQKSLLSLEKVSFLPKLNAFYNYQKTAYSNEFNVIAADWYPSSMVGLQLTLPITYSGARTSRINQAKLELEKAENEQLQNIQNLQMQYLTALTDLESAMDKYKNDKENRSIAQRIYHKTQIKFNNGIATSTELSQNETQYLTAYSNYLISILQLLQSKVNLDKAEGNL
ncbi:transporter [Prolixibacter bellariivorans]|uniref:Transporter n=1 Tax=Prolixibacter bellariivorans TaxID=314319 RepID=A0A5M4AYW9_9BACT|nr:TolC family protein [Prolixibacter bellariivorans]GET32918.1 transporter [Prolixibacter bellariivorans]